MRLHNLCLDLNIPLIDEEVGDEMDQEVPNNAPVQIAAVNMRQQLIELFH
jgi:hypothetical protein